MGQDRGRKWTNRKVDHLRLERMQNREEAFLDPKTMPTGIPRWVLRTKVYASETSGW